MTKPWLERSACFTLAIASSLTWIAAALGGETAIKVGVMADMSGPLSTAEDEVRWKRREWQPRSLVGLSAASA